MKSTGTFSLVVVATILLAACGVQSSNESKHQSSKNLTKKEDLSSDINLDKSENSNSTEQEESTSPTTTEKSSELTNKNSKMTENIKNEYLKKLTDTKEITEKLEATDSSTYALKEVENKRWEIWDKLLNEIYGVLEEQLQSDQMDQLRQEQRNWVTERDESALDASLKYKGGTQEHLEYVSVLANHTEERCYELVEMYMSELP
ncbi:lysozyme inhibitor LprI family protein [Bacillus weihaiensis]|uniref:lysozyme inhibitor LprI family protein n=1 Tax=Bacillus weihaiensis TaxID=1547283 RepID=UPI00235571F4|nr:lysozyme inhibitor LprI family protein [Bacillus weihaiensis]